MECIVSPSLSLNRCTPGKTRTRGRRQKRSFASWPTRSHNPPPHTHPRRLLMVLTNAPRVATRVGLPALGATKVALRAYTPRWPAVDLTGLVNR